MASFAGAAKARWFDLSDGIYQDASPSLVPNNGSHDFTPPGKNHVGDGDWVLLLQTGKS
jgi:hypothetical protein